MNYQELIDKVFEAFGGEKSKEEIQKVIRDKDEIIQYYIVTPFSCDGSHCWVDDLYADYQLLLETVLATDVNFKTSWSSKKECVGAGIKCMGDICTVSASAWSDDGYDLVEDALSSVATDLGVNLDDWVSQCGYGDTYSAVKAVMRELEYIDYIIIYDPSFDAEESLYTRDLVAILQAVVWCAKQAFDKSNENFVELKRFVMDFMECRK